MQVIQLIIWITRVDILCLDSARLSHECPHSLYNNQHDIAYTRVYVDTYVYVRIIVRVAVFFFFFFVRLIDSTIFAINQTVSRTPTFWIYPLVEKYRSRLFSAASDRFRRATRHSLLLQASCQICAIVKKTPKSGEQ